MIIAGFQKNSFVDFPGQIASVIFTVGCNMDCWYCHNHGIKQDAELSMDKIIEFLSARKGMIDGVVFTGGEILLQPDIEDAIKRVKELGFLIKLDTNGLLPEKLKALIDKNLLDYIAMDIKAPWEKYNKITQVNCDIETLKKSVETIMNSGVDYEFRTTMSPDLFVDDIRAIAQNIKGAKKYAIQQYRQKCFDKQLSQPPHEPDYLKLAKETAEMYIKNVELRGI